VPGGQGVRVVRAEEPLDHRQQRGVLVTGGGRVPGFPGPVGEAIPGGQGERVLWAVDPLIAGQLITRGVLDR
jgi:hypothetical protein